MKLRVNWLTFIRQNKALYKEELVYFCATCQSYLIIFSYVNEGGVNLRSRYSAC